MSQQQNNTTSTNISNTNNNSNSSARQPAAYSSPQQYPSPSMPGYAYPPPTPGQSAEPSYRASPTGSNVSLPSLNLPPIRTVDGRQQSQQPQPQQQQGQQQSGQPTSGPPLPPPMHPQYYSGHTLPPPQHMNVTSDPNQQHLRYPLPPPPDGRIMSGGRHKKEIKRRTKTGCLTCRKRRIKCDEAHPACRNCQKSKRDCLGYDPIFKAQPGPTAIQPAPSASPSMQGTPATADPYPPPPQGYVPAGSQPPSYAHPPSAAAGSQRSSTEPYTNDYGAAIDPALEGAGHHPTQTGTYDGLPDLKRGLEDGNDNHRGEAPFDPSNSRPSVQERVHSRFRSSQLIFSAVKRTKVDELLALRGVSSPSTASVPKPIPPATYDEIKSVYSNAYGPALDKFFETRWFQLRGLTHLLNDSQLCEQFAALIQRFTIEPTHAQYFAATAATHSLEATVVWGMMALSRKVANTPNPTNGQVNYLEVNDGVQDAAQRFEIFENLILGQYFDSKPEPKPEPAETARNGTVFEEQLKTRERDFWRLIHTFLSIRDDEASTAKEIDDTLAQCRQLLDSKENRDVLYSIVIARHLGARVAEFPNNLTQPPDNEESEEKTKLYVAKSFIEAEAGGKGTNQVIQRVCGMAVRSWTMPRY